MMLFNSRVAIRNFSKPLTPFQQALANMPTAKKPFDAEAHKQKMKAEREAQEKLKGGRDGCLMTLRANESLLIRRHSTQRLVLIHVQALPSKTAAAAVAMPAMIR